MKAPTLPVVAMLAVCAVWGAPAMQERRIVAGPIPSVGPYSAAVAADGLIYVSGLTGAADPGTTGAADIGAETRRAFDRLQQILAAAGSSVSDLVNVTVYLSRASDFDAMNAAYRTCVGDPPPARTTVEADLDGGARIALSAIAVPAGTPREALLPAGWVKSPRPYSYLIRTGDLVFLSGLVSRRGLDDQPVSGPIAVQMRTIMANAAVLLRTAGLTFENVVSARVFVTDDSLFEPMNAEYEKTFASSPPARATGVAGLMSSDNSVEMTFIASKTPKETIGPQVSPTLPVSTAIRAGRRVFLSGVVGNTDTNATDVADQAREALTRIGRTLDLAGLTFGDVVDSTVYLRDSWQTRTFDGVFREFFPRDPPARTVAGIKLIARTGLAEVLLTAVK